jgi:hypothetical protein
LLKNSRAELFIGQLCFEQSCLVRDAHTQDKNVVLQLSEVKFVRYMITFEFFLFFISISCFPDFIKMTNIRNLRFCMSHWHRWTKFRVRSAFSVNRSLGTESCCAILFWAMKFSHPPPVHFNWWTLYPKFRVYGTAAILSRIAKFIVYLRFARWKRAIVLARSCNSQAIVLQQAQSFSLVCKHFMAWCQAHCAYLKGCKSITSRCWKVYRSKIRAQTRLRALFNLVNNRLLSASFDFFALAVFGRDQVVLAKIPCCIASRITKSFLLPDDDSMLYVRMQKFVLRRFLQSMLRCWSMVMLVCKSRRLVDKRTYFSCWRSFVHSAQQYREQAERRHEQLKRLCSISQRVDKRMKFVTLRHFQALCRDRQNVFASVASVSLRLRVLSCVKTFQAVSRRNLAIFRASLKLRLQVACGVLRPVWRAWNLIISEKAHRKIWDRRESDAAFHTWLNHIMEMRQRTNALEVLHLRVLASRKHYLFTFWQALVESAKMKTLASEKFFKNILVLVLRKSFVSWRFSVFRLKWDHAVLLSCVRKWRVFVRLRIEHISSLKSLTNRNSRKMACRVLKTWRAWFLLRSHRRVISRKIECKRFMLILSFCFYRWSALSAEVASQMREQYQEALIFRAEVLVRAFFMRWRLVRIYLMDCTQKSLSSIARHRVSMFFSRWFSLTTSMIMQRLQTIACAALAHRNMLTLSFRLWRLFAFSHSHITRRVAAPDVASALAQSGRAVLSNMTLSQRHRVMLLPRVLQIAFFWFSQRGGSNIRESLLSSSADHGSHLNSDSDSNSSGSYGQGRSPLSMSQLFSSQSSLGPTSRRSETTLEWHLPSFGAKTSFQIAELSARKTDVSASQGPQHRAAQLQQMLEELYGKSQSP